MDKRERRERLEKLASLSDFQAQLMYYRCSGKKVSEITNILEWDDENKVWNRFTAIFKILETSSWEETFTNYCPIFQEFVKSEKDWSNWGLTAGEMLRQAGVIQIEEEPHAMQTNNQDRTLISVPRFLISISLLIAIIIFVAFVRRLFERIPPITSTPTSAPTETLLPPTATSTITSTVTSIAAEIRPDNQVIENFDDTVQGFSFSSKGNGAWGITDDGNGNTVLEVVSPDDSSTVHIDFGPPVFSNGSIEYQIRFKDFPSSVNDENEDWGSVDFHFRERPDGEESYVVTIRPPLAVTELYYVTKDGKWEWIDGGKKKLVINKNEWYSIRLDIQGGNVNAYINNALVFRISDQRLDMGALNFLVRPHTVVQFDNVSVQDLP